MTLLNIAGLCRYGARYVYDLVGTMQETFEKLSVLSRPPPPANFEAMVAAVEELQKVSKVAFTSLRIISQQVELKIGPAQQRLMAQNEGRARDVIEALIPFKEDDSEEEKEDSEEDSDDDDDVEAENRATNPQEYLPCSAVRRSVWERRLATVEDVDGPARLAELEQQHRELVEQCRLRNRQLKETIDRMRALVLDVNTMIAVGRGVGGLRRDFSKADDASE